MENENQENQPQPTIEDRLTKLEGEVVALKTQSEQPVMDAGLQTKFDRLVTQLHANGIHFDDPLQEVKA